MIDVTQDRFNLQVTHRQLIADYMAEIQPLVRATRLEEFDSILKHVKEYSRFLLERAQIQEPLQSIQNASKNTRVLDVVNMGSYTREVIYTAHLAACCNLFRETTLPRSNLNPDKLLTTSKKYISQPACLKNSQMIYSRLHNMDAIRTMQLLRAAGLLTRNSKNIYQLALGAGTGLKDIHYVHALPQIIASQNHGVETNLAFNITIHPAAHVIVADADPRYREHYARFSENDSPPVLAFNRDTLEVLQELKQINIRKRNLITLIRVDHNMIPDISLFLQNLQPLIDDSCDLILSIGLGDTLDEFRGRTKLVRDLFNALEKSQMQPVLFKLHGRGTLEQQWNSLKFGSPGASTYQVLYCKLDSDKLSRKYY